MADDWIKMRGALIDHPKVVAMTRLLLADNDFYHWLTPGAGASVNGQIVSTPALRCVVTGLLMRVWSVARATGKFVGDDLVLPHSVIADLDQFAGAPGIGEAMRSVDWVVEKSRNGGVLLPNFVEFNVPKTNAEKQREYRERQKKKDEKSLQTRGNEKGKIVTTREEVKKQELSQVDTPTHADRTQNAGATAAGRACRLMREAGCPLQQLNPSHDALLAALAEGVTPEALADTVHEALSSTPPKSRPFTWAIATARGRHAEAAQSTTNGARSHAAPQPRASLADQAIADANRILGKRRARETEADGSA